jgi:hypothetical protein
MAGILDDAYGVGDERRERIRKRVILSGLAAVVIGTVLYFTFRTWPQERVVKRFVTLLAQKDYQDAYKLWGCTPETPCKYYPPDRFTADWGPDGAYADIAAAHIDNVDFCDTGVVFTVTFPKADAIGLWVERETNVISFAPWVRCPGRHLHLWEFLKSRFTS